MSATAIKIAPAEASVMPPKLELRGISKSFPGVRALSEVSWADAR